MLTAEQKRLRLLGYGASEVPTIVGAGGGSLEELYASKVNGISEEPEDEQLAREMGTLLEDPIARIYGRRIGRELVPVNTLQHPSKPLAIATPDRAVFTTKQQVVIIDRIEQLADAERLAEVKSTQMRFRYLYGEDGSSTVPEEKALQVIWQMGVTGMRLVDVVVLFIGEWKREIITFPIAFSQSVFEWLYESAERFDRDFVQPRRPPPPNGSARYSEFLKKQFPKNTEPMRPATEDEERLLLYFAKLDEASKRLKKSKHLAHQQLLAAIGNTEGLSSLSLGSVTYRKTRDSSEIDWQRVGNDALRLCGLILNTLPEGEQRAALEARVKRIVPDATKMRRGYRRLVTKWQGEAALELAQLNLMLDALEANNEPENENG